jgi:trehalose-phosphatase
MKKILKRLERERDIILFLDYDGTIVPIVKRPELAKLHPMRRKLLERISRKIPVAIVSGRSLYDLEKLVKVKGIYLIGNHGLEILFKRGIWVHPYAIRMKKYIGKTLKRIEDRLKNIRGVIVENKGLSGSIHYRLLNPDKKGTLKSIIEEEISKSKGKLKMKKGKKVFEIRLNLNWNKGDGLKKLLSLLNLKSEALKIYIGDDETDEDAFRVFERGDLTILVGKKRSSFAKFRLKNVREVWIFLKELLKKMGRKGI